MTYKKLQKTKTVHIFIDKLGKYVKANVSTKPFFDSENLAVTLKGNFNKYFYFEIHINNEYDFNKYKIKY